ncbi:MAG: hypothetical protein B6U72_01265 [Candidatus Altiarchaeales archaeon ex4484_2]|nr:MAG: hypothetical protein B6U72_01265 [Candidatus Altiarchaeales archaeon ex4484_2]
MSEYLVERIKASGHPNVSARHKTTLEVTGDNYLTPTGDCIVAINADRCFPEFSPGFLDLLKSEGSRVEVLIECNGVRDKVTARGDKALTLNHGSEMVVRKSSYVCGRTLAVKADKAAADLKRELVDELKRGNEVIVELRVY